MAPAPNTLLSPAAREAPDDLIIRVINLDRDAQRLAWMRGQLDQLGLTFRRFPALTPSTLPESIRSRFHPDAAQALSAGEIGCFASHLKLAEELLSSGDPCWLILEDDVEIAATVDDLRALARAAGDQHFVKLSDWPKSPSVELKRIGSYRLVRYWLAPRGSGAYFLTRRGAEAMLASANNLGNVIDDFIRQGAHGPLNVTGVVPPPAFQDRFQTSSIDPGKTRLSAGRKRRVSGAFRRLRRAVAASLRKFLFFGAAEAVRLEIAFLSMRAQRIKRDTTMRYVLSARNPWRR